MPGDPDLSLNCLLPRPARRCLVLGANQDAPPFSVGCVGPNDDGSHVTVAQCRDFYTGCGDTDKDTSYTVGGKSVKYDLWCPCFDANGKNTGEQRNRGEHTTHTRATRPRAHCACRPRAGLNALGTRLFCVVVRLACQAARPLTPGWCRGSWFLWHPSSHPGTIAELPIFTQRAGKCVVRKLWRRGIVQAAPVRVAGANGLPSRPATLPLSQNST